MIGRVLGIVLAVILFAVLFYTSRYWPFRWWDGDGLLEIGWLRRQGDLVDFVARNRDLRERTGVDLRPLAAYSLLIWAVLAFLLLSVVQAIVSRFSR
ncbi:MAG: hypothetical protein AAF914_07715 [Pseudomonadota bacterium]